MAEYARHLEPHHNVFVLDRPGQVSKNISIPKTVIATMANWIKHYSDDGFTQDQIDNFNRIPEAP